MYCSTVAVHGLPRVTPAGEDAPLAPENVYGVTKLEAERVALRIAREHRMSALIARLTPLYGPGDRRCLKLFRDVARGRLTMIGAGAHHYHLTYVDDAVAGLERCGRHRDAAGDTFIIGSDERPTVNELVRAIADAYGVELRVVRFPATPFALAAAVYRRGRRPDRRLPGFFDGIDFFLAERTFDISKANAQLAFRPEITLREGIRRTAEWYRRMNLV